MLSTGNNPTCRELAALASALSERLRERDKLLPADLATKPQHLSSSKYEKEVIKPPLLRGYLISDEICPGLTL